MQRVIALDGGRNFRDLGGYRTTDGRSTRWQRLYRTGVMSYLTERGHATLQEFQIRVVCDLRSAPEREREPFRPRTSAITRRHWDYDPAIITTSAVLPRGAFSADDARSAMIRLYRSLPKHFEAPYAGLFCDLASGQLPLIFGCAAGKDRTGVAAALVLSCLGVRWEDIVADFVLTNSAVDLEQVVFHGATGHIGLDEDRRHLLDATREARAPLIAASPEYLEAAFDQINRDHGCVDAYLRDRLGVSAEVRQRISHHLLEDRAA